MTDGQVYKQITLKYALIQKPRKGTSVSFTLYSRTSMAQTPLEP